MFYYMEIPHNKAIQIAKELQSYAKGLMITGSLYRNHEFVKDIDFLTLRPLYDVLNDFKKIAGLQVLRNGSKILSILIGGVYHIDIWHVPSKLLLPFYKLEYDEGLANIKYKRIAKKHGMKLSINGLTKDGIPVENFKTKEQIMSYLRKLENQ